jgi:hypothetical protein
MNENRTIHLVDIPIGGKGGFIWNRLHEEREGVCEALLKDFDPLSIERKKLLQARLFALDDALDRLMAGSYGNCSKCGKAIDDTKLDIDPALALCLDCWVSEHGHIASGFDSSDVALESLRPFDTIFLQTYNSDYRILLLDPTTGRALVEGGKHLVEPKEGMLRGSAVPGEPFKPATISIGGRLEMWVNERVFLTSIIKSVDVRHSGDPEPVENISAALH